jgi:DNA-binding NarL/FixJ family response regulator
MIRVLLVDDHDLMRAGIRVLLSAMPDIVVCGESSDGREAIRLAKELHPDIILMDISMPNLNGIDATAQLRETLPGTSVLILSMHATKVHVLEAIRAGAAGYVLKTSAVDEMEEAIRTVARGGKYITPQVSGQIIDGYTSLAVSTTTGEDNIVLTGRQREVLRLVADGHKSREIADRLHLSVKTVETHRAQIMFRLGVDNVAGLTRAAIRLGLIHDD